MYFMAGRTEDKGKAHLLHDAEPVGLEFQMTVHEYTCLYLEYMQMWIDAGDFIELW